MSDKWMQLRSIKFGVTIEVETAPALDHGSTVTKLGRAGCPREALLSLAQVLLGEVEPSRATAAALEWWTKKRSELPLLALLGPTGLGKSTAAARAAYEFAKGFPWNALPGGVPREPLVWLNAEDIVLLQGWFTDGKRQYDEAQRAQLLVIDDAGHEKSRPAIAALTDLLLRRMDAMRSTVLSTNLRGAAFAERYGAPVVDRLKAKGFLPELGGLESLRKRAP